MVSNVFDNYTTVAPMFRGMPQWVGGQDQRRIAAYNVYEQVYWNVPEVFKLVVRGGDTNPIYIPAGKQIVDTLHRYLANDVEFVADREYGSDTERVEAMQVLTDLVRRERFHSKFQANKRYGIIRGDWLWHIVADPERSEGSRISIYPVDPASYFPIYADDNVDVVVGCHIVEPFRDNRGRDRIRRLTYRKETGEGGPSPIIMSEAIFNVDEWGGPDMREGGPAKVIQEETRLPAPIDSLPVYHIQNFLEPQNPWGSSELRGMERVIAAIDQAISDEELALALEGLGVYVTDSGPPIDDAGNEMAWRIAPANVVEVGDGKTFQRVQGVSSVAPIQDHLKYLHNQLDLSTGTPDVAKGQVDVSVAESGVALALRMGPLLSRANEREQVVTDVMSNLLFDLRKWYGAYEPSRLSAPLMATRFLPKYGDKIPMNREGRFKEIIQIANLNPPVVSRQWVREQLREIGYTFPDHTEMMDEILEETTIFGQVSSDIEGFRLDRDLAAVGEGGENEDEDEGGFGA